MSYTLKMMIIACLLLANMAQAKQYEAFRVEVTGHGQPVILIPGATCSGDEWKETVAHWKGKYECHILTIAGYAGVPPMNGGPYLAKVKQQIEEYIADNKLQHVIIVGHSIGGVLGLWLAADGKADIQKLVVVDAMPFFAAAQNPGAADTFSETQAKAMYDRYRAMDDAQLKANQLMMAKFMCLDSGRWNTIAEWGVKSDRKTMAYSMMEMLGKDLRKSIGNIQVPVLVLAAYSNMPQYAQYTRVAVQEQYEGQYKNCGKCVVKVAEGHTKHFVMYDNPGWFYKELDSFLQ